MTDSVLVRYSDNSSKACVLELFCPNSYYAYPKLLEIEPMPDGVRNTVDNLWRRSVHAGRKVKFFEFSNVFVAKEGLVFDESATLIPETRTYHSDDDINEAINEIKSLSSTQNIESIEKCILAKSRGATNYGHFILEMLPRAWMARKHLHVDDWPVLIHRSSPELVSVASQSMNTIGVDNKNIIVTDRKPVFVKRIIVVDGLTSHTQYLSPFVLQCLDEVSSSIQAGTANKIYASRGPRSSRDFLNEGAVAQKLAETGFVEKFSGALDFRAQVETFKGAECIVGVMGAALTNIAFCNPGTPVFCFMPSSASEVLFWMIAQARRLNYYEIRCAEAGPQIGPLPWDRSITIDPDLLASIVTAA